MNKKLIMLIGISMIVCAISGLVFSSLRTEKSGDSFNSSIFLSNVDALSQGESSYPNDRDGMEMTDCYKEVIFNGRPVMVRTGAHCVRAHYGDYCNAALAWGEC